MNIEIKNYSSNMPNFDEFKFVQNRYMRTKVFYGRNIHSMAAELIFNGGYKNSRHFLISDNTVNGLYGDLVESIFINAGYTLSRIVCDDSEGSKSFAQFESICTKMLDIGFDKNSFVISLGGGVVNNLAGFIASTLYRGINLAHIPTSLLSQVDAAIDFKQALNTNHGKNLVGSFYPASVVLVDSFFLRTLDERHFYNGLA
ncbi:MAG: 3-dehydroquinate synthase, partial [Gammaproteobacteria bacterium]|nr:3-dehydroquinate synthase [Gammaproteobacteria bacterium]